MSSNFYSDSDHKGSVYQHIWSNKHVFAFLHGFISYCVVISPPWKNVDEWVNIFKSGLLCPVCRWNLERQSADAVRVWADLLVDVTVLEDVGQQQQQKGLSWPSVILLRLACFNHKDMVLNQGQWSLLQACMWLQQCGDRSTLD